MCANYFVSQCIPHSNSIRQNIIPFYRQENWGLRISNNLSMRKHVKSFLPTFYAPTSNAEERWFYLSCFVHFSINIKYAVIIKIIPHSLHCNSSLHTISWGPATCYTLPQRDYLWFHLYLTWINKWAKAFPHSLHPQGPSLVCFIDEPWALTLW